MLMGISEEFETSIFNKKKSIKTNRYDNYWVAFNDNELIGTISIFRMKNESSVLKNMFVKKEFRGKVFNVSQKLLLTTFKWCKSENIKSIYLGTMEQFVAAQKFYQKNGFQRIEKEELPESFVANPIDTVFYRINL